MFFHSVVKIIENSNRKLLKGTETLIKVEKSHEEWKIK